MTNVLYSNIASVLGINDKGSSSFEDDPTSPSAAADCAKLDFYIDALISLFNEFNSLLANEDFIFDDLLSRRKELISLGEEVDKSTFSFLNEQEMSCIPDKLAALDERIHLDNLMKNLGLFGKENLIMHQVAESITKYITEGQGNLSVRNILLSFVKLKCFVPVFEYTKETMRLLKSDIALYEVQEEEIEYYIDCCALVFPEDMNIDKFISSEYVSASLGYEIEPVDIVPYCSLNETLVKIDRLLIGQAFESIQDTIDYIKQLNLTHY